MPPNIKTTSMQQFLRPRQRGSRYTSPLKRGFPVGEIQSKEQAEWWEFSRWHFSENIVPFSITLAHVGQRVHEYPRTARRISLGIRRDEGERSRRVCRECVWWGGRGGRSTRVADLDLKAEKVTLAPEHPLTPPALPCARTALTRTPALAQAHCLQAALLARLQGKRPLRSALAGGEAAHSRQAPGMAPASGRRPLGVPEATGRERGARAAPAGLPGADWRGGGKATKEGATPAASRPARPALPSLPPSPLPAAPRPPGARLRKGTGAGRAGGRRRGVGAGSAEHPPGPGMAAGGALAPPGAGLQGASARPRPMGA